MPRSIEIFCDFRSPCGCLAFSRLLQMDAARARRRRQLRPVMARVGNVPTTITCAAGGRHTRARPAWAAFAGFAPTRATTRILAEIRPFHDHW